MSYQLYSESIKEVKRRIQRIKKQIKDLIELETKEFKDGDTWHSESFRSVQQQRTTLEKDVQNLKDIIKFGKKAVTPKNNSQIAYGHKVEMKVFPSNKILTFHICSYKDQRVLGKIKNTENNRLVSEECHLGQLLLSKKCGDIVDFKDLNYKIASISPSEYL